MREAALSDNRLALYGGGLRVEAAREALHRCFPGVTRVARHRFVMAAHLADLVAAERKLTTIRFEKAGVEYPASQILPLFIANRTGDHESLFFFANICIQEVRYKSIGQLDEDDALADGFTSLIELLEMLRIFYGALDDSSLVSIYTFELASRPPRPDQTEKPKSNARLRMA